MSKYQRVIYILNCWFRSDTCIKQLRTPQNMRAQLNDIHSFDFPVHLKSTRRYNSEDFLYMWQRADSDLMEVNYACRCCPGHFDNLNGVRNHFQDEHKDFVSQQPTASSSCSEERDDHDGSTSSVAQKSARWSDLVWRYHIFASGTQSFIYKRLWHLPCFSPTAIVHLQLRMEEFSGGTLTTGFGFNLCSYIDLKPPSRRCQGIHWTWKLECNCQLNRRQVRYQATLNAVGGCQ